MTRTITVQQAAREMVADLEEKLEMAAERLSQRSGLPLEVSRGILHDAVGDVLPPSTRVFMQAGTLPNLPD
jgi:hypothetical protein